MKLNKTFGRVATTLVATAMLASVAAVPAFAADSTQGEINKPLPNVKINKVLELPKEVDTPTAHFDFTVTADTTVAQDATISVGDQVRDLYAGAGNIVTEGVDIAPSGDAEHRSTAQEGEKNEKVTYEVTFTLPDNSVFEAAGVYKYIIDETDPNVTNHTEDDYIEKTNTLDLYLIVERVDKDAVVSATDKFQVTGAYIYPHEQTSEKTADYLNYYKLDNDGERTVGDLNFKKEVKGAMANMSDTFTFTVSGAGIVNGTTYTIMNGETESTQKAENGCLTFTGVGNGADITIVGIDPVQYTITETEPAGYNVSTSNTDEDQNYEDNSAKLTVKLKDEVTTTFTNTKDAVSPTGLIMDIAPYALLVAVAAAGCFVFLRKRRED